MKLFCTTTSPYARIARIASLESGLNCKEEFVAPNLLRTRANPVLEYNCAGRVPTLVDGDKVVTETRYICQYIDNLNDKPSLFSNSRNWAAQLLESTAISFLDACALWTREYRRDESEQSHWLISVERDRAERILDWCSSNLKIVNCNEAWGFAQITLAVAIDYQAYQGLVADWAAKRENLLHWFELQSARPAMRATSLPKR